MAGPACDQSVRFPCRLLCVRVCLVRARTLPETTATYIVLMGRGYTYYTGTLDQVLTTEQIRATYGVAVEVVHVAGRRVVLWN